MAEPVRPLEDEAPTTSSPGLTAVADVARAVPDLGRWALVGAVVGFVVVTVAVTVATMAQDVDLAASFGLALSVGVFGGLGFGCMVGSVLALALADEAERRDDGS